MHEPFASLDDQTRLLLSDKMLQIQLELSQTALFITHNITEAVQPSDRILVMAFRRGRAKQDIEIDLRVPARRRLSASPHSAAMWPRSGAISRKRLRAERRRARWALETVKG